MRATQRPHMGWVILVLIANAIGSSLTDSLTHVAHKLYFVCAVDSTHCLAHPIMQEDDLYEQASRPDLCGYSNLGRQYSGLIYVNTLSGHHIICQVDKISIRFLRRFRRQSEYRRGRYRGQTQSQYLNVNNANGKYDGKAEAQSAADSSRAVVSGSSGMGQAQSQSMYDPSCDECVGREGQTAASLQKIPNAFPPSSYNPLEKSEVNANRFNPTNNGGFPNRQDINYDTVRGRYGPSDNSEVSGHINPKDHVSNGGIRIGQPNSHIASSHVPAATDYYGSRGIPNPSTGGLTSQIGYPGSQQGWSGSNENHPRIQSPWPSIGGGVMPGTSGNANFPTYGNNGFSSPSSEFSGSRPGTDVSGPKPDNKYVGNSNGGSVGPAGHQTSQTIPRDKNNAANFLPAQVDQGQFLQNQGNLPISHTNNGFTSTPSLNGNVPGKAGPLSFIGPNGETYICCTVGSPGLGVTSRPYFPQGEYGTNTGTVSGSIPGLGEGLYSNYGGQVPYNGLGGYNILPNIGHGAVGPGVNTPYAGNAGQGGNFDANSGQTGYNAPNVGETVNVPYDASKGKGYKGPNVVQYNGPIAGQTGYNTPNAGQNGINGPNAVQERKTLFEQTSGPYSGKTSNGSYRPNLGQGGYNVPYVGQAGYNGPNAGQGGTGTYPGQTGTGSYPGQAGTGLYPGQAGNGPYLGQAGTGSYPGQTLAGPYPGQTGSGAYPGQTGSGSYPGQTGSGSYPGQAGTGPYPGQAGIGVYPGQAETGTYPGHPGYNVPDASTGGLTGPGAGQRGSGPYDPNAGQVQSNVAANGMYSGTNSGQHGYNGPSTAQGGYKDPKTPESGYNGPNAGQGAYNGPNTGNVGYNGPGAGQGGNDSPIIGQGANNAPNIGPVGYNNPNAGQGGFNGPSYGQVGFNGPSSGQGSYSGPSSGQNGNNVPTSGQGILNGPSPVQGYNVPSTSQGYNGPTSGQGGYNGPGSGRGSYIDPSSGQGGGYFTPNSGQGSYYTPSSGQSGNNVPSIVQGGYNVPGTGEGQVVEGGQATPPYSNVGPGSRPVTTWTSSGPQKIPGSRDANETIPQNVLDLQAVSGDDDESEALASVSQNSNGTTANASSKGGNKKGRAQTQVQGTYTGSGTFSAQAGITDETKAAESQVNGGKQGASSNAQGKVRENKSQANVQLGSETGAVQTLAQSVGRSHSSNSQVQGSVKGGMADAQAKGPGSTSSQAQIGFTPYKEGDKARDAMTSPFVGGGTASAHSGDKMGQSQSQLQGAFQYGISYNGAAQAGSSIDKDMVIPNRMPFVKLDVFDEEANFNIDGSRLKNNPQIEQQSNHDTRKENKDVINPLPIPELEHPHSDHHSSNTKETSFTPTDNTRSISTRVNNADYEYGSEKDDNAPDEYETDAGFGPDAPEYPNYEDIGHELESTKKGNVDIKQSTGGSTQHIVLGELQGKNAEVIQKNSNLQPDYDRIYQPGEVVPGTDYTIPAGFTGSVKSLSSKDSTYAIGSKESPSQAQTVSIVPGIGKVQYMNRNQSQNPKYVDPKNLKSLPDDKNRYMTVSKSVTGAFDGDHNLEKQYSHTYYTKSSSCGYFTFSCTIVSGSNGRKKVCRPKIPTNPDGTPMKC